MGGLVIKLKVTPLNFADENGKFIADFVEKAKLTHKKWVFQVLEYIVKYHRLDTGRSRAAWTPFMDANMYPYQRSYAPGPNVDYSEEEAGKTEGFFVSQDFRTLITNNVEYVNVMNETYGLFGFSPGERGKRKEVFGVTEFGNRVTMGIRLEERYPLFESMAATLYTRLIENAAAARGLTGKTYTAPDPSAPDTF